MSSRIEREKRVVEQMIQIYCRAKHTQEPLCVECRELLEYSHRQLDRCRYGSDKGFCSGCKSHCYRPDMRARIAVVMRYSGKRMIIYHPLTALWHIFGGR